jgi:uncharacterized protein (TIGR03546 family)
MLKLIAEVLKIINSETEPRQISLAVCFALIVGLGKLFSLHNLLVVFLVCILRVNLATFFLVWPLVAGIAYVFDPLLHQIGLQILTAPALIDLWTAWYNNTFFALTRFNNTIVMGGLVVGLVLFVPCFFLLNGAIRKYREHFLAWVQRTKLAKLIKASRLFEVYQTVLGAGGAV